MRLKILLLIAACSTMTLSPVFAQQTACQLSVSGHVYISDTSQLDARGASIKFPSLKRGGITDSDGFFNITGLCPGKSRIVISYQGYKTLDTVFNITHDLTL